ncbi:MAG: FAD-dependent thymidylate synthase [Chloroflexi bacterium]|nr:FAD-dependent thymidylate synthase [Chloroflexota bacterium]
MVEELSTKFKFGELSLDQKVDFILKERTPRPEQVTYQPTVEFLDPAGRLTREERGRAVAMGDRTAIAYRLLVERVRADREKPAVEVEGEEVDATSAFYLLYALAARSSREIAHTSILEQVNVGPGEFGGDPPIVIEGISVLSALRDICSLRHFGFEAFSSRGAIFPEGYWRIPPELRGARIGSELEAINRQIYEIYLELAKRGVEYYLQKLVKGEGEKGWQYRWRVLSHALDDARQVTNGSFLNHLAMHPNSALALREVIAKLSASPLPETREVAEQIRKLVVPALPTLMRHTEAPDYLQGLRGKSDKISHGLGFESPVSRRGEISRSRVLGVTVSPEAERIFLAAFLGKEAVASFESILDRLGQASPQEIEDLVDRVFGGIGLHDKPPEELEMVQLLAHFEMSVGAMFEAIRHRLATHIVGRLTPEYGFTIPSIYPELGLEEQYLEAISLNEQGYDLICSLGGHYESVFAPYFVARAHLVPVTMRISGLDVFHMIKLRASEGAHPDIKQPMRELEEALRRSGGPIFRHLMRKNGDA